MLCPVILLLLLTVIFWIFKVYFAPGICSLLSIVAPAGKQALVQQQFYSALVFLLATRYKLLTFLFKPDRNAFVLILVPI